MRLSLITLLLLTASCAAFAQDVAGGVAPVAPKSKQPVEIEADNQLEWLRDKAMYRGSGNVTITQGPTVIRGDTAEAHYDAAIGPSAMTSMIVDGHVVITNGDRIIHAEHGTYDPRTEIVVLTGNTITMDSPGLNVVSHKTMEWHALEHKAVATGNALVTQPEQKLKAENVTAWIDPATNKLQRAEAAGNVLITRTSKEGGTDVAQANKAIYNLEKNMIDLLGHVKLTRGTNHMEGEHATVDLTTGYSTLKNDGKKGGRVRAVFTPGGDGAAPMPSVTGGMPTINSKKRFEQPYEVGVKDPERGNGN